MPDNKLSKLLKEPFGSSERNATEKKPYLINMWYWFSSVQITASNL